MFKKTAVETKGYERSQPNRSVDPNVSVRRTSIIGPTLTFRGELSANEDLIIEGCIEGTIAHQDKNLTVGKKGRVSADIHAKRVEIYGEVEGDIESDGLVKIGSTAVVIGNVICERIVMEDGAQFFGGICTKQMRKKVRSERSYQPGNESAVSAGALSA